MKIRTPSHHAAAVLHSVQRPTLARRRNVNVKQSAKLIGGAYVFNLRGFRCKASTLTISSYLFLRFLTYLTIRWEAFFLCRKNDQSSEDVRRWKRERISQLTAETVKWLLELIDENKVHFPHAQKVFLSCYGEEVKDSQMNKRLKYYGDITGVGKEIRSTAHTWRHTAARNYILNGGDPYTLMRLLGHSSLQMTRRYVQMITDDVRINHEQFSPVKKFRTRLR
ncbi:tyrosine-type recombinase/integrase [Bacillus sp. 37MA]|uniref:tyrosine-type recombinase/integrase n=1 Tax=Bacillus sp. 37MA TaxID=1132442 RepID=UPI0018CBE411|nr:tyrosine-type recombinase/integrase [Bacillus sp. 37MA]